MLIHFSLIPGGFYFFKRGQQQKTKKLKPLGRKLVYFKLVPAFVQMIVFMHYTFKGAKETPSNLTKEVNTE